MPPTTKAFTTIVTTKTIATSTESRIAYIYRKYGTILIFIGLFFIASVASPAFLTQANLTNVLRQVVVVSLLACGVTFVIILGQIDVSLGAVMALAGTIAASFMVMTGSITMAISAGLTVGALSGLVNGLVITTFRIPSFIMTLAMASVARGTVLLYTGGAPVIGLGNFRIIGQGDVGPLPVSVAILATVVLLCWVLLAKTRFGRYVYAVGGNARAARASGVRPTNVIVAAFVLNGGLCGLAGIVFTSRINSGQPAAGAGYEFDAITSVIIGGTSLMGGTGSIAGTIIGSFVIGIINNILNLLNVSSYWQQIAKGLIIALAVILDVGTKFSRGERA
jgi:inositol transport system permease protein